jgi:hypothetical protein
VLACVWERGKERETREKTWGSLYLTISLSVARIEADLWHEILVVRRRFEQGKRGETGEDELGNRGCRWGGGSATRGRRGSWGTGAVPLPVREGETVEEEDTDRWVPPVIGGREGEGYPFGILAGWAMGRLRNWAEWDPRGPFPFLFCFLLFSFLFFLILLYLLHILSKQGQTNF